MSDLVAISPETGEVFAFPVNGDAARRLKDGSWVFGPSARLSTFEEMEEFTPVKDPEFAATLLHEARAAFSSSAKRRQQPEAKAPVKGRKMSFTKAEWAAARQRVEADQKALPCPQIWPVD